MTQNEINQKIAQKFLNWTTKMSSGYLYYFYPKKDKDDWREVPDFYNSNAAAIELLPVLIEKGYQFCLEDSQIATKEMLFRFAIYKSSQNNMKELAEVYLPTISEAICTAIISLIESEESHE